MFAIEFKETKYESLEHHLEKIIEHAKATLECLEWHKGLSLDNTSEHDSDNKKSYTSRY